VNAQKIMEEEEKKHHGERHQTIPGVGVRERD